MSRSTVCIKKNTSNIEVSAIVLSAGIGAKIKSSEPRSLIQLKGKHLIDWQTQTIKKIFKNVEIVGVFGAHIDKIIRKNKNDFRIVENQLFNVTNNSESLRLGLNNCVNQNVFFVHGDIYFTTSMLKNADFSKSFLVVDGTNSIKEKEVGVTVHKNKISVLSYGLEKKWCQMCYLTGRELKILKSIFLKFKEKDKKMLSFEVINKIIELGGSFECFEQKESKILEIDCIKDLNDENFNM